jgi:glycosyltransferase involved in cell wall biosynthesis
MTAVPRLSIGLPVYNGARYLAGSIEALLGQSYQDFELIISDNASTDDTPAICHHYEEQDSRIRYFRQQRNIGHVPNHNFLVGKARGEFFKWAAHDDLYARDLIKRCVGALDEHPEAVLAHSWVAVMDDSDTPTTLRRHPAGTASPHPPERFRSMLYDGMGDYTYAVMRTSVLRRTPLHESFYYADRTLITELALHGTFCQVEDWLFFRRDHPSEPRKSVRERCAIFDPRRANRLRNPAIRLYAEYIWGYISAIRRAPLSPEDRRKCYRCLAGWVASRAVPARNPVGQPLSARQQPVLYLVRWLAGAVLPGRDVRVGEPPPTEPPNIAIDSLVPGRDRRSP